MLGPGQSAQSNLRLSKLGGKDGMAGSLFSQLQNLGMLANGHHLAISKRH